MKIVHATWEKRNLGMDAWEITVEKRDLASPAIVLNEVKKDIYAGSYVCVKMPVGNLVLLHALEDEGFRFMEVQQSLIDCLEPRFKDLLEQGVEDKLVSREIAKNPEDWEKIIGLIVPGMFATDRIALDPAFGPEVACDRYRNWVRDLLSNPRSRLTVSVRESTGDVVSFGVDVLSETTGEYRALLGGTFPGQEGMAAAAFALAPHGTMRTTISSNNPKVLRVHQSCGRVIYKELYVLRKIFK